MTISFLKFIDLKTRKYECARPVNLLSNTPSITSTLPITKYDQKTITDNDYASEEEICLHHAPQLSSMINREYNTNKAQKQ